MNKYPFPGARLDEQVSASQSDGKTDVHNKVSRLSETSSAKLPQKTSAPKDPSMRHKSNMD